MTLEEFKQKIEAVSDRRLLRMLERAQTDGLQSAVAIIEAERVKRAEVAAQALEELTSQIRPLEEVLGHHFGKVEARLELKVEPTSSSLTRVNPADFKTERLAEAPAKTEPSLAATSGSIPRNLGATSSVATLKSQGDAEEMAPLISPLTLPTQDWSHAGSVKAASPHHPQRGWVIFAIILLMLAGFFAIWRALVG